MKKALTTLLLLGAAIVFGTNCKLTPKGRAIGEDLFIHAARETISHEMNPNTLDVNVYNQQQIPYPVEERRQKTKETDPNKDKYMLRIEKVRDWMIPPPSFVFRKHIDTNGDKLMGKDELIGLGSYFECKNKEKKLLLGCGSTWWKIEGKRAVCKIKETETGKILTVDQGNVSRGSWQIRVAPISFTKGQNEGIKSYTMEWYIDGKNLPSRTREFFVDYGAKQE